MYYWYPVNGKSGKDGTSIEKQLFLEYVSFFKAHPKNSKFSFYFILLIGLFMLVSLIVFFFLEILVTFIVRSFKREDCK